MDVERQFLHFRVEPFRNLFQRADPEQRFAIKVIGYRQPMPESVYTAQGLLDTFIYFCNRPARLGTHQHPLSLRPPSLVIHAPGRLIHHENPGGVLRSWIRCTGSSVAAAIHASQLPCDQPIPLQDLAASERYLLLLNEEMLRPGGGDPQILTHLFSAWLQRIAHTTDPHPHHTPSSERIDRIRAQIDRMLDRKIDLDALAQHHGVSRSWLNKAFRSTFGIAPNAYIINQRLLLSTELLMRPDWTVEAVALRCGFSDVYYFSRLFKQRMGTPPGRFRTARKPPTR